VRALAPHIGAWVEFDGERLGVDAARVVAGEAAAPGTPIAPLAPGEWLAGDGRLLVGCAEGTLELLRVKPAGGRVMDVESIPAGPRPSPVPDVPWVRHGGRAHHQSRDRPRPELSELQGAMVAADQPCRPVRCVYCLQRFELRLELPELR